MTTLLVLLLIASPASAFFMLYNQRKLEHMFKSMKDDIKYLKDNSLLLSNDDLIKSLNKKDAKMSSISFNSED